MLFEVWAFVPVFMEIQLPHGLKEASLQHIIWGRFSYSAVTHVYGYCTFMTHAYGYCKCTVQFGKPLTCHQELSVPERPDKDRLAERRDLTVLIV